MTQNKVKAKAPKLNICKDVSGSILPLSAIALIALAGMVGGGVDMSRSYMVQNRLQNACDSGVLAGRRAVDTAGFTSAAKGRAEDFFDTNFDEENEGVSETTFVASSPDNGNTVNGAASTSVDTVVMRLFGFDEIALNVNCTASMSVGNSDVIMVLDSTGSMGWDLDGSQTRIQALRTAMKAFYDTVEASADGGNSRIRYGFVPYSSGVNVGSLLYNLDPSYIADTHDYQSRKPVFKETTVDELQGYEDPYEEDSTGAENYDYDWWYFHNGSYRNNSTCRINQPSNTDWTNGGSFSSSATTTRGPYINGNGQRVTETRTTQSQSRTEYTCYRRGRNDHWVIRRNVTRDLVSVNSSIEDPIYTSTTITEFDRWNYIERSGFDTSNLKRFASVSVDNGTDGTNENYTWDGCVEERETVANATFSFSSILGLDPSGARDLDIDGAPTGNKATKWKPMFGQIMYGRTTSDGWLTNASESDYGFKASYYCPKESQTLQTMSEGEFDAFADALDPDGFTYHSIGMIWGARLASPDGIFESNVNEAPSNGGEVARHIVFMSDGQMDTEYAITSSYGIEWHDRRVTDNGYSDNDERHAQRFLAACDIAKSKGIRVWVIAFATDLTTDLETCASDDSAFPANSASQLNEAFQEIAKDVGELRITQ